MSSSSLDVAKYEKYLGPIGDSARTLSCHASESVPSDLHAVASSPDQRAEHRCEKELKELHAQPLDRAPVAGFRLGDPRMVHRCPRPDLGSVVAATELEHTAIGWQGWEA
jgi:hypothetical protein